MTEPGGLQFDKAEPDRPSPGGGAVCLACRKPIAEAYYTLNAQILCPACKNLVETHGAGGSRAGRVLKALLYGLGAALVGTIIYVIMLQTNYEFALVAILVGFLVGKAVRAGSGGRAGRGYQVMAVVLTYASIVSGYIPKLLEAALEHSPRSSPASSKPGELPAAPKDAAPSAAPAPAQPGDAPDEGKPGCFKIALALVVIFGVACAVPWLAGFENILGWIIIAVALIQAWRLTRAVPVVFRGPFRVGGAPPPSEAPPLA